MLIADWFTGPEAAQWLWQGSGSVSGTVQRRADMVGTNGATAVVLLL